MPKSVAGRDGAGCGRAPVRTAPPSIEPSSSVIPTTAAVTTAPRRSTRRRSAAGAAAPYRRQASRLSRPSSEANGAPAISSGLHAARKIRSGVSYTGTARQLTVNSSTADSAIAAPAASRCQSPRRVSTPTTISVNDTTRPEPTGCAMAKASSGSATFQGCSEDSQRIIEPRSPPSKYTGSQSLLNPA